MKNNESVSSYLPTNEFHLTIIDVRPLPYRLATAVTIAFTELKRSIGEFRNSPLEFINRLAKAIRRELFQKDRWVGVATAVLALFLVGVAIRVFEGRTHSKDLVLNREDQDTVVQILPVAATVENPSSGIGINGRGRVGLNRDRGEGSHSIAQKTGGGGSGGNGDRLPAQVGKLPVPSPVQAAIPKTPPLNPRALPAAGIDLDPTLWRDLKLPQYGDPLSKSTAIYNGPGVEGGMGTRRGTGVGDGTGPGFGPGDNGNTGGRESQRGCCGPGASNGNALDGWESRVFRGNEVEQRARIVAKPEPQYTEEASAITLRERSCCAWSLRVMEP